MLNATPTPITPPRVPLIDQRTGLIDRAWYMFFLSLFQAAQNEDDPAPNASSLIASYDAALAAVAQEAQTLPVQQQIVLPDVIEPPIAHYIPQDVIEPPIAHYIPQNVIEMVRPDLVLPDQDLGPRNELGVLASQSTVDLAAQVTGILSVPNGGTGQTTFTNGQLLIGNTTGNTLAKATLTQGTGVTITNSTGSITIASVLAEATSVFTSGTAQTYTAPANTQWVRVTVVGPGGNGAAVNSQRATGGGGGGVAIKGLIMSPGQTLIYTVGTASGTASTVSSGTLAITTISGGSGANGAGTAYAASVTAGATGGAATGGDVNITGGRSCSSFGSNTTVLTNFSGNGGDCPGFGTGGLAVGCVATAGTVGNGFGAGGGGSHGNNTAASGTGGIIIFEAF